MNKEFLSKSREIRIGVIVIIAIGLLFFGLNYLKGVNIFSPTNYYVAIYKNVDGLVPSNAVYIKGYKVGQIDKIVYDFNRDSSFMVYMTINKDLKLPKGTRAELADEGLVGGKQVNLVLGPASETYYHSGDIIESSVPVTLMETLKTGIVPNLEKIVPKLDSLVTNLNKVASDPAIGKSLASIQRTTANLDETSAQLKSMMHKDVPQIITKVNKITDNFASVSDNLRNANFAATIASINHTLANLESATGKLNSKDGTLGLLLNDKTLYVNLSNMTGSANDLMVDLKAHPKRYVHFSVFGKKDK
ncbi:MlaD family protein [Paludibacter sp.]|uniref:MlaD family protein n=1 Tax=Paludibacter sp. TaxID=1898105 RepID=UPI001354906A|nr:MlaD family protein [Paludibacter sp.]MTK52928.1 MCE family protein [Paludibacter sp.]